MIKKKITYTTYLPDVFEEFALHCFKRFTVLFCFVFKPHMDLMTPLAARSHNFQLSQNSLPHKIIPSETKIQTKQNHKGLEKKKNNQVFPTQTLIYLEI